MSGVQATARQLDSLPQPEQTETRPGTRARFPAVVRDLDAHWIGVPGDPDT